MLVCMTNVRNRYSTNTCDCVTGVFTDYLVTLQFTGHKQLLSITLNFLDYMSFRLHGIVVGSYHVTQNIINM